MEKFSALKCWPGNQVQNDKEAQEKSLFLILTLDEEKVYDLEVTRILQPQPLRRDVLTGILESQNDYCMKTSIYYE